MKRYFLLIVATATSYSIADYTVRNDSIGGSYGGGNPIVWFDITKNGAVLVPGINAATTDNGHCLTVKTNQDNNVLLAVSIPNNAAVPSAGSQASSQVLPLICSVLKNALVSLDVASSEITASVDTMNLLPTSQQINKSNTYTCTFSFNIKNGTFLNINPDALIAPATQTAMNNLATTLANAEFTYNNLNPGNNRAFSGDLTEAQSFLAVDQRTLSTFPSAPAASSVTSAGGATAAKYVYKYTPTPVKKAAVKKKVAKKTQKKPVKKKVVKKKVATKKPKATK